MKPTQLLNDCFDIISKIPYKSGFSRQTINTNIQLIYLNTLNVISNKQDCHNLAIQQLQTLINVVKKLENGLIGGNLELMWLIGKLINSNILEQTPFVWQTSYEVISRNLSYVINSPYQVDVNSRFHAIGVAMMALYNTESDDLNRYVWEEQIIFKLCDCAKLLSESSPPVYEPAMLTAGIIHSIIAFSDLAIEYNIYPFKAYQIRNCALELNYNKLRSNLNDILILQLYKNMNITEELEKMHITSIYKFLAEIGTLSTIYKNHSLFEKAMRQCRLLHPNLFHYLTNIPKDCLLGITIGLSSII